MDIKFNDLTKQWNIIKKDVYPKLDNLFEKSNFIGGEAIDEFEKRFAEYIGTKYAIGVSNGTDGLKISLKALNLQSPCGVILPANTFIATVLAVSYLNDLQYDIKLVDCDEFFQINTELLESCLKENRNKWKSCVIIPVHLFGHPTDMKTIIEISEKYDCLILEDSSQAHGAMVMNKKVGSLGDISAFSLYPGKNLGAAGDAGIITTNNEEYYENAKALRNYGSKKKYYYEFKGWNNRLDTIQAIIVNEKLKYLDEWNSNRIKVAHDFDEGLKNNKNVIIPKNAPYIDKNVYHIYAIRVKTREKFQEYLKKHSITTIIHYPVPIQKTKPYLYLDSVKNENTVKFSNEMVSLPIHPFLKVDEIDYIIDTIKKFYE